MTNPRTSTFDDQQIDNILMQLQAATSKLVDPLVTHITKKRRDPFQILIATILSLRTKDTTTYKASRELFAKANTPKKILELSIEELEELIYPVGFYHRKAQTIRTISERILEEFD